MMEFMMARVSACICAALIVGMMFVPVTDTLMDDAEDETQINCDTIGTMLDRFASGGSDEAILFLNTYLPGEDYSISFEGKVLELVHSDVKHMYTLRSEVIADRDEYHFSDAIRLTKEDGALRIDIV